jgi:hypothetical protein
MSRSVFPGERAPSAAVAQAAAGEREGNFTERLPPLGHMRYDFWYTNFKG